MGKTSISRNQKIELYNKLVATHPDAVRKGVTIPYTSVNGHMYSMFTKEDYVGLRLPEGERTKFIRKFKTKLVEQYGIVQKEYVVVPDDLLENTDELKHYFYMSYQYISTLKPKPVTRSKTK